MTLAADFKVKANNETIKITVCLEDAITHADVALAAYNILNSIGIESDIDNLIDNMQRHERSI